MSKSKIPYTKVVKSVAEGEGALLELYDNSTDLMVANQYLDIKDAKNASFQRAEKLITLGKIYLRYLEPHTKGKSNGSFKPSTLSDEEIRDLEGISHNTLDEALSKHFRRLSRLNSWEAFGLGLVLMAIGFFLQPLLTK